MGTEFCYYLSSLRSWGGVEQGRSGRCEGEGCVNCSALPYPENLTERSFSDPSRCAGGVRKSFPCNNIKLHNLSTKTVKVVAFSEKCRKLRFDKKHSNLAFQM